VVRRLVITNGEWTTRHEIGEAAIVIGRDPSCDLFFVNQKLSRRHARFEPGPDGVELVDLGSRNGIWVNQEKIDRHRLVPGDTIRLGGLRLVYEDDSPSGPDATVLLPRARAETEQTVVLGDVAQPEEAGAATVILGGGDASTHVFRSSEVAPAPAPEEPLLVLQPETSAWRMREAVRRLSPWRGGERIPGRERFAGLPWQTRFVVILSGLGLLLVAVLVWVAGLGSAAWSWLMGLVLCSAWSAAAVFLARKLIVTPVATLARDVEALRRKEKQFVTPRREYRELAELAESINRLTGNDPFSDSTVILEAHSGPSDDRDC
jgi:FHA domain